MPRQRAAAVEIFISHSSRNHAFAERLVKELNRHGLKTYYSKRSIRGAQQWHDEIGLALARCSWFLIILSPQSVASEWVKHEYMYAMQSPRYLRHIVPVLFRNCNFKKFSWTLPNIEYVDFRKDFDKGCRDLLGIWGVKYRPET